MTLDVDVERVENFIAHYASKYYDPAKAREYYLKTRELKGREPALSKESNARQREATAYVSDQIREKRQSALDKNQKARDDLVNSARKEAEAHAARMEKLQKDAKDVQRKISDQFRSEVEKIRSQFSIPENASPQTRARLQKQLSMKLNTMAIKVSKELTKIQDTFQFDMWKARTGNQKFREDNAAARKANSTERRNISEGFRKDLANEKKFIKDKVR